MPHIWEKTGALVVTQEELIPAWFPSYDALRMAIKRCEEKNHGIKRVQKGGGGHPMLIAYDSLPAEIQTALGDPRRPGHLLELYYQTDPAAVRFYTTDFRFDDGGYLGQKHQDEYIVNASVLQAAARLKVARENERRSKGGSLKGVMGTICADVASFKPILLQKFNEVHTLPDSEKRFKEAFRNFHTEAGPDYKSLISGKLRNSNRRLVTDDVVAMLNDLFAGQQHKPTRTEVSRCFDAFLSGYTEVVKSDGSGECYDPKDFRKLSDATIINYLGAWEHTIGTHAVRSSDRQKLMGQFQPFHKLKRPAFAGSLLSIDDRQPPFLYEPKKRLWIYAGMDVASDAIVTVVWDKTKEALIMNFYRQLVRDHAMRGLCLPAELEAESSLNSSYTGTFLRPGAMFSENVHIAANNARAKWIERRWGMFRYDDSAGGEKAHPAFQGRPHARREDQQMAPGAKENYIPYDQLVHDTLRRIEDWNNSPHDTHKGKTRWDVYLENQHPGLKPINWPAILPHMGYCARRIAMPLNGILEFQKQSFLLGRDGQVATGDSLIHLMKQVAGEYIDIYYLDGNDGKMAKALIYQNDCLICEAVPQPEYNRSTLERRADGPQAEAARALMSAYENTVIAYQRQRKASINDVIVIGEREKTLNRKFVMPGLTPRYVPDDTPAPALDDVPEDGWMPVAPQPSGGDYLRDF